MVPPLKFGRFFVFEDDTRWIIIFTRIPDGLFEFSGAMSEAAAFCPRSFLNIGQPPAVSRLTLLQA
jgi:hypothetical protein